MSRKGARGGKAEGEGGRSGGGRRAGKEGRAGKGGKAGEKKEAEGTLEYKVKSVEVTEKKEGI